MQHRKIMTAMVVALMLLAGVSALSFAGPTAASEDRAADVEYGGIELTPEQAAINEQIEQRGKAQQDAEAALWESGVNVYGLDDETLSSLGDNRTVVVASAAATPANGSAEQLSGAAAQTQQLLTTCRWDVRWTYYSYQSNGYVPCKKIYTELLNSVGTVVQTGNTDDNGWITYYVTPGTYNVMAHVDDRLTNKVSTTSGTVYKDCTGQYSITTDTYHPNHRFLSSNPCCKPFDWYHTVLKGWDWLKANTPSPGWSCPAVTTYWPVTETGNTHTHMGYSSCYIDIPSAREADLYSKTAPLHEWAHVVHYWARGGSAPSGYGSVTVHGLWTEASVGSSRNWEFAFVEGWAIFLPCAVWGTTSNMYPGYGDLEYGGDNALVETYSDGTGKVYADCTRAGGNTGDWDGWDCEGAVAACLWDLFDGGDVNDRPSWSPTEYRDGQGPWFSCVWHVFKEHQPSNMYGMYTGLNGDYTLPNYWWYGPFYNARMNYNSPYTDT